MQAPGSLRLFGKKMPAALSQLEVAAAGRRGLPHLAIENYSQIQAKKETPESASENDVNPRIHVAPAKAGAAIDLPSRPGMYPQRPRLRRADGLESIAPRGDLEA